MQRKVVVITGAAGGVGLATATTLINRGARVVIADVDEGKGREAAYSLGETALYVPLDVANAGDWQAVMEHTRRQFGAVDAVINNAAVFPVEDIEQTSLHAWRKTLSVNADGVFLGCKYAINAMKERGGAIVNIASTAAVAGHPGMCAYSASKGAVCALTRNVAAHCLKNGYRIRCNTIIPGGVRTAMTEKIWKGQDALSFEHNPSSPFCEPEDVAALAAFLVSDEAHYINGSELRVDNAFLVALG